MRRLAPTLLALALTSSFSAVAFADCPPGDVICATVEASIHFGGTLTLPGLPLPAPVVVVPPPPVVVVPPPELPAPPVFVPGTAPQRTVIIVIAPPSQPAYAPPPPPAPTYYAPAQPQVVVEEDAEPVFGDWRFGIDLRLDGAGFGGGSQNQAGFLGGGLGLRYRALKHLGFEAGIDVLGGHDYEGRPSTEYSLTAGTVAYVNPRSRAQLYFTTGGLVDKAKVTLPGDFASISLDYTHLGGYAGVGLEFFLGHHVALHGDVRGVLRERVGGDAAPEFRDAATGRTTNLSAGAVASAGLLLYF